MKKANNRCYKHCGCTTKTLTCVKLWAFSLAAFANNPFSLATFESSVFTVGFCVLDTSLFSSVISFLLIICFFNSAIFLSNSAYWAGKILNNVFLFALRLYVSVKLTSFAKHFRPMEKLNFFNWEKKLKIYK